MKLVIIDYGAGNIKSIQFAFKRLGVDAILSNDINEITAADKIIFPGVGEASSAMKMLETKWFKHTNTYFKTTCFRYLFRNAVNV